MTEQKSAGELQEHMLWTYYGLRVGLVAIGIALPILVVLSGLQHHGGWRGSLSDYYNVPTGGFLTPRDVFVGGLLAAAACLYLYKGYSNKENRALNVAGVSAVLVAFFPTGADGPVTYLHRTAAVIFFLCIAYVCLFRSKDTLDSDLVPEPKRSQYARIYTITGGLMIASPAAALLVSWWFERSFGKDIAVLAIEAFGVWVFAGYWGVKTLELRESEAEKLTLQASLERVTISEAGAGTTTKVAPRRGTKRRDEKIVRAS